MKKTVLFIKTKQKKSVKWLKYAAQIFRKYRMTAKVTACVFL